MNKNQHQAGFTLIELLIVILIVGVLSALAIPSYHNYTVKADRTDAMQKLTEVMFSMEHYALQYQSYTTQLAAGGLGFAENPVATDRALYRIHAETCGNTLAINQCVRLVATPLDSKRQRLSLDSRGIKTPASIW